MKSEMNVGGVLTGDGHRPVGFHVKSDGQSLTITTGIEYVEISEAATGEPIGWVPYAAAIAHGHGYLSLRDLKARALPTPPEGMKRSRGPWKD